MTDQKNNSHGYYSVFTPKQSQQRIAQAEVSNKTRSQFTTTQKNKGTSGSPAFICIDGRRKYKYNEK